MHPTIKGLLAAALATTLPLVAVTPPAAAQADAATGTATIAEARRLIAARYVLPEVGTKLAATLAEGEAAGRYRGLAGEALAARITADLDAVAHDRHLSVSFDPRQAAALAAAGRIADEDALPPGYARDMARGNGGVSRLELLPGNIRYLRYDGFHWGTPGAEAALATAMAFLKDGDAIIIDLRTNGGGWPQAVAAMTSYFLPEGTPLARFAFRDQPGTTSTTPRAPFSLAGKPLFVLTSRGTGSAAEEFATHVSAYGFGTLVGTPTAGAAYRNDILPLPGGYLLSVSVGRPVHAKTGGDWEAKGVAPAIAVPAEAALIRAQAEAMAAIHAAAPADEKAADARLLAYYRGLSSPIALTAPAEAYAGRYGDRIIAAHAGGLTSRRGERVPMRLVPIGENLFVPEVDPATQFRFELTAGRAVALVVDRGNGPPSRLAREEH